MIRQAEARNIESRDPISLVVAAIASTAIGSLPVTTLPFIVGSMIQGFGISEAQAGFIVGLEVAAVGLTTIGVSPFIRKLSRMHLAMTAGVLMVFSNTMSMFVDQYVPLLLLRGLNGVAAGLMTAASKSALAEAQHPERFFSWMLAMGAVIVALLLQILPFAMAWGQHQGVFLVFIVTIVLFLPMCRGLPGIPAGAFKTEHASVTHGDRFLAALVIGAAIITSVAVGGVWAFTERIGIAIGLQGEAVGTILALSSLASVLTAFVAAYIGMTYGRRWPLAIGLASLGIGGYFVTVASGGLEFAVANLLFWCGWYLHFPYIMGAAASLDRFGRLPALTYGVFISTLSIGPIVGGILFGILGFVAVGWLCLLASFAAFICMWPICLRLDSGVAN